MKPFIIFSIGCCCLVGCGGTQSTNGAGDSATTDQPIVAVSSSEAIERLKEQGVTFQDGPEMGLFADLGLLTSFADSDIGLLAAVTKLKAVRTHGSATNETLQKIATLDQLEMLAVTSPISDADLQPLSTMGNLRTLILWSDKLTAAAVGRLKSQMGKCNVVWRQNKPDAQR